MRSLNFGRTASCAIILSWLGGTAGCTGTVLTSLQENNGGDDGGGGGGGTTGPDGGPVGTPDGGTDSGVPLCPGCGVPLYVRGDLPPIYELTPKSEYGQYAQLGVNVGATLGGSGGVQGIDDTDFGPPAGPPQFTELQMMNQLAAQIQLDDGLSTAPTIVQAVDQTRAGIKPFRGKPTDVKFVDVNGATKLYVPLGGEMSAPGNQVAVFAEAGGQLTNAQNVQVGVRPQRVAVHADSLVFVCNQYSNYISIIDPRTDTLLQFNNKPVEIPTQYFCSDLLFAPVSPTAPNPDDQFLYVANRWRRSIIKYHLNVQKDAAGNPYNVLIVDHPVNSTTGQPDPALDFEGIETNFPLAPLRLALADTQDAVLVASGAGGGLYDVQIGPPAQPDTVISETVAQAPAMDVVAIASFAYVPTTTGDRGLESASTAQPTIALPPIQATGLDGQQHTVNPGSQTDNSNAYGFEDVRNGLFEYSRGAGQLTLSTYYTDDTSPETNYLASQKILTGGLGTAVVRNAAGTKIYVAQGGSDQVQELLVNVAGTPTLTPGRTFTTQGHRPYALNLAESHGTAGELYVADWGSETVEVIDLGTGNVVTTQQDLFGTPSYPATNVERGELAFYDEAWSNNGRKACASCHLDWEMQTDGFTFGAGRTSPAALRKVGTVSNVANERDYWNAAVSAALAFEGQTRDNCRIVEFGLVDGPGASTRTGDLHNVTASSSLDPGCVPVENNPITPGTVSNQSTIDSNSSQEQATMATHIQNAMGLTTVTQQGLTGSLTPAQAREELLREIDVYTVAQVRVPPNPLAYLLQTQPGQPSQISSTDRGIIQHGEQVFSSAGCGSCHTATATDALGFTTFTDGLPHGPGADWARRFVQAYQGDPRLGNLPATFTNGLGASGTPDKAQVTFASPIDFFIPFCFDSTNCVEVPDPLNLYTAQNPQNPNYPAESAALQLILTYGLGDKDIQDVPGFVVGGGSSYAVQTPSLRGVWRDGLFLHSGVAHSVRESNLAPGHPALQAGEIGYAIDSTGSLDVHGNTSTLSPTDVQALLEYLASIP